MSYSGIIEGNRILINDLIDIKFTPNVYYTDLIVKQLLLHDFISVEHSNDNFSLLKGTSNKLLRINDELMSSDTILSKIKYYESENYPIFQWKEIANWECIEFLIYHLEELDIDYKISNSLIELFYNLLEYYSVGQLTNIAYSSVESSLYQLRKGKIGEKYVFSYILDTISKKAERALKEGYSYHNFNRNAHCSQSILSKYYFTKVLSLNEEAFNSIQSKK